MTPSVCWRAGIATVLLACAVAHAHENLPASLLLEQRDAQTFDLRWRVPATQGAAPELAPRLPDDCTRVTEPHEQPAPAARMTQWQVRCTGGLRDGARIAIDGLSTSMLDAIVRVGYADGRSVSLIARPREPSVTLPAAEPHGLAVSAYLGLGVEHILTGIDHLLFVLCLILLVRGRLALLKTITAFTLAHSATLALSALGLVQLPQAPVEAAIALSILFLACELAKPQSRDGMAARRPWAVAFAFGLLHGFGFAGALAEVGLPQGDVPLALLLFNLGVEVGQLIFVAGVLLLLALARRARDLTWPLPFPLPVAGPLLRGVPVLAVGSLAAFWCLQRMAVVLGVSAA